MSASSSPCAVTQHARQSAARLNAGAAIKRAYCCTEAVSKGRKRNDFSVAKAGTFFASQGPQRTSVMRPIRERGLAIVSISACCLSLTACERASRHVRQGPTATGSWHDEKPGVRRLLEPGDLPGMAKPTSAVADVAMAAGAGPLLPDGFSADSKWCGCSSTAAANRQASTRIS
jgi:hypothetical protein